MNLRLLFASYALFLTSCIAVIERDISISAGEDAEISVEQAREFFEQELLTRNDDTPTPNILSPGDFTPQWDNAKMSQNSRIACVDVPIISTYRYRAIRSEFSRGHANAYRVDVSQKLVIVKDRESGAMASYVMSLIPDKEFAAKHKGDISGLFLNANARGKFSGTVLYTHHGIPVTVNKYIDGVCTDGATICGIRDDVRRTKNFNKIVKFLSKIRFKKCSVINSRGSEYDDEEPWWDEDEDDWSIWDIISTLDPSEVEFDGNGVYDLGNGFFLGDDGNIYFDYDNDGVPDSQWTPPVIVEPDPGYNEGGGNDGDGNGDGNETSSGSNNSSGDNNEGGSDDDNTGEGNDDNTDEYYESLGQMGFDKIRSDLSSGDFQINQATMSGGEALIRAFSLGANSSYGIVASCLNFMNQSNLDQYALKFGMGMSRFSAGIGILQTIIVCIDGDITNGDILTAISAALGTAAIFISAPVTAGIVGVTGCIIGLISCFVTENMPKELYINLGNGVKATIYILDNFMYV